MNTTTTYIAFLTVVYAVVWSAGRTPSTRAWLLAAASLLFHALPHLWMVPALWVGCLFDLAVARNMRFVGHDLARRRAWLVVGVGANVAVLLFSHFGPVWVGMVTDGLGAGDGGLGGSGSSLRTEGVALGDPHGTYPGAWDLWIPLGLGLLVMRKISFLVDVYRDKIQPPAAFVDYLAFVAFFPQTGAGPVARAKPWLSSVQAPPRRDATRESRGMWLILLGMTKKWLLAEIIDAQLCSRMFAQDGDVGGMGSAEALLAVYGLAFRLYLEWSAYGDIANGSAMLLGFDPLPHFRRPYAAANLLEFWRRWHISWSAWLYDYVFLPLRGGTTDIEGVSGPAFVGHARSVAQANGGGILRVVIAGLLTAMLGGWLLGVLWYGASASTILWGAIHGGLLLGAGSLYARNQPLSSLSGENTMLRESREPSAPETSSSKNEAAPHEGGNDSLGSEWGAPFQASPSASGNMHTGSAGSATPVTGVSAGNPWGVLFTFHIVAALWVLFCAPDPEQAVALFHRIVEGRADGGDPPWAGIAALALAVAAHYSPTRWRDELGERFAALPPAIQGFVAVAVAVVLVQIPMVFLGS